MKRSTLVALIAAALLPLSAAAFEPECLGHCDATPPGFETACGSTVADRVEGLNNKVKPLKDIAGYVKSPQGLAMKLVNDHVVKIPAWVGYAIDPIGSLKNRAMGEARDHVKASMKANTAACAETDAAPIDSRLLPVDSEQI